MPTIYYVQEKLKIAFMDALAVIRKTVANVMAIIIVRGGFNIWPDLLRFLVENLLKAGQLSLLDLYSLSIVEASIHTISIIVEDCSDLLQEESYVAQIEFMIQPIFGLLLCPYEKFGGDLQRQGVHASIETHAINTVNMLLIT